MPRLRLSMLVLPVLLSACTSQLPDPESAGAQLYRTRCSICHRLYAPRILTGAMWEVQLERMQTLMERRGVPPLTGDERAVLLAYLKAHGTDAPKPARTAGGA